MTTIFTLLTGRELTSTFRQDGTEGRVSFETDQGTIEIASTPEGLANLGNRMSELAAHVLGVKSAAQGLAKIHVAEIARAKAEVPKNAPIVAIGLMGTTGSVQHFGLSPETSASLRQQMEAAESQALENRKRSLQ